MFNVVLIEPEIPPNTGNIGRLCLATKSTLHLVKPFGFSLDDRELKRAGLDYWEDVDVQTWDSFAHLQGAQPSDTVRSLIKKQKKTAAAAPASEAERESSEPAESSSSPSVETAG